MCGRFAQSQTREDYLALLAEDIERDIPMIPNPLADTTSHREPKSFCSVNVTNTFIWIRFSGDMLPDGGINRH
ncbi:Uncharacterised protein [Escherichia coli]|nr:Uncharacterised protein [Escherichia coli]